MSNVPTYKVFEVLRAGARGAQVKAVQTALPRWALSDFLKVDGIFGPATEAAVKSFQSALGLTSDGAVGPATGRALGIWVDVLKGFDASHWNTILWDEMGSDVSFGIFKATQGVTWQDPEFRNNVEMARYADLTADAYHFTEFENSPYAEAAAFLDAVAGVDVTNIFLDLEYRKSGLSSSAIFNWVQAFMGAISGAHSKGDVGIYTSRNYLSEVGLSAYTELSKYSLWAADWQEQPFVYPWTSWSTWQYTSMGGVSWAEGPIDLNYRIA